MPEGHSVHRIARQFKVNFVGERPAVSSPQGRFSEGAAMIDGRDPFLEALIPRLESSLYAWTYRELDPDVFGEELLTPGYQRVERIAVVALIVTRIGPGIGGSVESATGE